jgi:hypothetical protein
MEAALEFAVILAREIPAVATRQRAKISEKGVAFISTGLSAAKSAAEPLLRPLRVDRRKFRCNRWRKLDARGQI